jgi:hypothetical protein
VGTPPRHHGQGRGQQGQQQQDGGGPQHDGYASLPGSPASFSSGASHAADRLVPEPSLANLKRHVGVPAEGDSELVLRPAAPVYTIDVDPAATYQTRWAGSGGRGVRWPS